MSALIPGHRHQEPVGGEVATSVEREEERVSLGGRWPCPMQGRSGDGFQGRAVGLESSQTWSMRVGHSMTWSLLRSTLRSRFSCGTHESPVGEVSGTCYDRVSISFHNLELKGLCVCACVHRRMPVPKPKLGEGAGEPDRRAELCPGGQ